MQRNPLVRIGESGMRKVDVGRRVAARIHGVEELS
jgi:hypothetical protein